MREHPRRGLVPSSENQAADGHRLGYVPALDGIRALAVLAVMAYHGGVSFLPAGFFGVDAFFVLSGFLITTLLLTEWLRGGTIRLKAFWSRRVRRLLAALLVVVLFVVVYARFVAAPGMYPELRWDSVAAIFYSANWRFIASAQNYFVQTGPVSPLLHTWSLAIEEQFYILWPLILLAIARRSANRPRRALRIVLTMSVMGAVASAVEMAALFHPGTDPTRIYFGTDTHAQCLLVGAALAAAVALVRNRERSVTATVWSKRLLTVGGVTGVVVCAVTWSQWQYGQSVVYRGGFLVVSISVAAVIAAAVLVPDGIVSRALGVGLLRFIGRISYGMYLWHFPLDIALTAGRTGTSGWTLFLIRSVVTVVVATISFYAMERPIRTRAWLTTAHARFVAPAGVVVTSIVVVVATAPPAFAVSPLGSVTTIAGAPGPGVTLANGSALDKAPVRVMVVGDSVARTLAAGLVWRQGLFHAEIVNLAILGCGVAQGPAVWQASHGVETLFPVAGPCQLTPKFGFVPWETAWKSWLGEVHPNVVVLLAGLWEGADRFYHGHRTNILNPVFATYVRHQLERAVQIGTSKGARMVLMTEPCSGAEPQPGGAPFPEDQIKRVQIYNGIVRRVAAEFPADVVVQDLFALSCPRGRFIRTLDGAPFRPDGVHYATRPGTGADRLAGQILPLWEQLGHLQEEHGGPVIRTPVPTKLSVP
jgi:peptidoglycan/LPS O-acetylase OafA/YrhL